MDPARPLIAGLVAAVAVAGLAALAARPASERAGWRHLKPSAMHWTGVGLGAGLVLLFAYIRLFVGSSRPDAAHQMNILTGLIAAFALGTVAVALSMIALRRQSPRWRGGRLVWRSRGEEQQAELADLQSLTRDPLGYAILTFASGQRLKIDPYATGAQQLIEAAGERLTQS